MPSKYSDSNRRLPGAVQRRRFLLASCAIAIAAIGFASVFFLIPYSRRQPKSAQARDTTVMTAPPTAPALMPPSPATMDANKPKAPPPSSAVLAPLAAALRGFGLRAASIPRIARDFSLGPLQSYRPAEGDEASVFVVATSFMKGIAEGRLDRKLLLPRSRDALSELLAPSEPGSTASSAVPYRLGEVVIQGCDASLKIRLPTETDGPRIEGLLSLRKEGDTWYVEALALDPPLSGPLAFNPDALAGAPGR